MRPRAADVASGRCPRSCTCQAPCLAWCCRLQACARLCARAALPLDVPTLHCAAGMQIMRCPAALTPCCPHRNEYCTVSNDGSVRIWDLATHQQRVQFDAPGEHATCAAYHPLHAELAVGFANGRLRVFDVATTTLIQVRGGTLARGRAAAGRVGRGQHLTHPCAHVWAWNGAHIQPQAALWQFECPLSVLFLLLRWCCVAGAPAAPLGAARGGLLPRRRAALHRRRRRRPLRLRRGPGERRGLTVRRECAARCSRTLVLAASGVAVALHGCCGGGRALLYPQVYAPTKFLTAGVRNVKVRGQPRDSAVLRRRPRSVAKAPDEQRR